MMNARWTRMIKKFWPLLVALLLVALTALAEMTLPGNLTTIESEAFAGCESLSGTVIIPNSVTYLAKDAFTGTNVTVVGGPGSDTVITMTDLPEGIAFEITDEGAVITGYTGQMDAQLRIPATINGIQVVEIGQGAFRDCHGLTGSIVIPQGVKRIGASAFFGCSGLNGTISIPSSVTEIGDFAFYECLSLTGSLTVPSSVKCVGNSAFAFCEGMTGKLSLPAGVSLGARCFQGAGFTGSITIPATMTLGPNVFAGTKLNITWKAPAFTYDKVGSVVTITGWNGPVNAGLTIPSSLGGGLVTGVAAEALADAGLCGTLSIPGSVVYIGENAFCSNPGLTGITFAEGLQTVAAYAFADCTGLSGTITLPSTVTALADTAFDGTNVTVRIGK